MVGGKRSGAMLCSIRNNFIFLVHSTPQYSLASDVPLNLWNVEYKDETDVNADGVRFAAVRWQYDEVNMHRLLMVLQSQWTISSVQTTMMKEMLTEIEAVYEREVNAKSVRSQTAVLLEGSKSRVYQPLMTRVRCSSLENRIAHYAKKRRIELQCVKEDTLAVAESTPSTVDS